MDEWGAIFRTREGSTVHQDSTLMIYPEATKYRQTQLDPFSTQFQALRNALNSQTKAVCCVCGYSFRDEHINAELERALKQRNNELTILAFVRQTSDEERQGLPPKIWEWLTSSRSDDNRLVVVGSRGFYHGDVANQAPVEENAEYAWWTFQWVTEFLRSGPRVVA